MGRDTTPLSSDGPPLPTIEEALAPDVGIVNDISSLEPSDNDVLAEEAVLNSSVDLAVSKAALATTVSKESYLVKLSLEGVPSKPLTSEDISDDLASLEPERISANWMYVDHIDIVNMKFSDRYLGGKTPAHCWYVKDLDENDFWTMSMDEE